MKRRPELDRFFRAALLAAVGRSSWLLVVFVIFVLVLEVAANLLYDVAVLAQPLNRAHWIRAGILVAALLAVAALFFVVDLIQVRKGPTGLDVSTISPHPGLIWLLSPGNPEPLLKVMRHHTDPDAQSDQRLRHCWLILSDHPAMENTFASLPEEMARWGIHDVALHPVYLPLTGIEHTYRAVRHIYEDEVAACGLRPDQVVTDLTGGLKIMTAGALMACLPRSGPAGPIEYLLSQRDPITGEPLEDSEQPMKLDLGFFPSQSAQRKEG